MAGDGSFGPRLRKARTRAGLSQSDLESRSGIPKATLSRYENDRILPSLGTLARLAKALDTTEAALLPGRRSPVEALSAALERRRVDLRAEDVERVADLITGALTQRRRSS